MTRDETQYRPAELVELLRADVLALLVILSRHADALTDTEAATVAAIAEAHGR